jgi:hypothetical protein
MLGWVTMMNPFCFLLGLPGLPEHEVDDSSASGRGDQLGDETEADQQ